MADFYAKTRCRMCDGANLTKVLSLAPTPPGNNFLDQKDLSKPEPRYPLDLCFCGDCHHVQLGHVVDPKILYQNDYRYVSATSSKFVQHLRDYAVAMVQRYSLGPASLVVDIGSNDGTCLRGFRDAGTKVLGVDPATEIARRASDSGIETIGDFFSLDLAVEQRKRTGPAAFITSHNACAHIDHLDGVMGGVQHWLADDGVFVLEVGYFLDVYSNVWFDTIYHEHLDYHTVAPFLKLFARVGLEAIRVERIAPQGGSIRVFAQHAGGPRRPDGTLGEFIALERQSGLDRPETFVGFGRRIDAVGAELRALVRRIKAEGKSVAGYGAATKSTTLLCHFGLDASDLEFIVDDNLLKQGRFSPAAHIPIVAPDELYRRQPDFLVVTAWNFADPIIAAHQKFAERGGRFILPMPTVRIV